MTFLPFRPPFWVFPFLLLGTELHAQMPDAPNQKGIAFRSAGTDIKAIQQSLEERDQSSQESQRELDDLTGQKQTAESQLKYAQSQLASARKRIGIGNSEQS